MEKELNSKDKAFIRLLNRLNEIKEDSLKGKRNTKLTNMLYKKTIDKYVKGFFWFKKSKPSLLLTFISLGLMVLLLIFSFALPFSLTDGRYIYLTNFFYLTGGLSLVTFSLALSMLGSTLLFKVKPPVIIFNIVNIVLLVITPFFMNGGLVINDESSTIVLLILIIALVLSAIVLLDIFVNNYRISVDDYTIYLNQINYLYDNNFIPKDKYQAYRSQLQYIVKY